MSKRAWVYVLSVIAIGAIVSVAAFASFAASQAEWEAFVVLTAFATFTQLFKSLFKSKTQSNEASTSYSPTLVFFFAGVLLLSPFLFVLLVIIPHLIEWAKDHFQKTGNLPVWYIQPFNIANHIICGLAAIFAVTVLYSVPLTIQFPTLLICLIAGVMIYATLNHILVG